MIGSLCFFAGFAGGIITLASVRILYKKYVNAKRKEREDREEMLRTLISIREPDVPYIYPKIEGSSGDIGTLGNENWENSFITEDLYPEIFKELKRRKND
jgi:hypothetical protein